MASPPDWDALLLALLAAQPDPVLQEVLSVRSAALSGYARHWFGLVGQELLADIADSVARPPRNAAEHSLSFVKPSEQVARIAVVSVTDSSQPGNTPEQGAGDLDGEDPPLNYQMLYSPDAQLVWLLTTPVSSLAGVFRAVPLNARDLSFADVAASKARVFPGSIVLGSCMSALYRAHSLSNLHRIRPPLLAAIIAGRPSEVATTLATLPGGTAKEEEEELWPDSRAGGSGVVLNEGQCTALEGLDGVVELVQGPPGTGKSSFITEVFLQRIPRSARVLACTSTNKAIDSLVAKFEAVGVSEMVSVGSRERMGDASQRFLMSARISRDPVVARAEGILASVRNKREVAEEKVAAAKKPKKPKKEKGGKENNRGFVKRVLEKLKADKKVAKKTPGIVRLMKIVGVEDPAPTNAAIVAAGNAYLQAPPDEEDAAAFDELSKARQNLKTVEALESRVMAETSRLRSKAARRVWRSARFVACTAASAVHVTRRICQDLEEEEEEQGGGNGKKSEPEAIRFDYVILDEAGAMLEPDALGTLIHGARAVLMVGDHFQLQPFSKWQAAASRRYNVSLMERLLVGGRSATMLTEQYRMHPEISDIVSRCFYKGRVATAAVTARARQHPLPANFIEVGGEEDRPRGATSWQNEMEADVVVEVVQACVHHGGHEGAAINVITFYNGQRSLIAGKLTAAGLRGVDVISVDAMQGREVDVVVLSCVRTSRHGLGFLADWRRLNVALSRAREQLVVVGSRHCLQSNQHWARALERMHGFPDLHGFKRVYFDAVPAGWSTGNAARRQVDASAGAYKSAPGAPPPSSKLDAAGARELAALESLTSSEIPAVSESSVDELSARVESTMTVSSSSRGAADAAWDGTGVGSGSSGAAVLQTQVADCWEDDEAEEEPVGPSEIVESPQKGRTETRGTTSTSTPLQQPAVGNGAIASADDTTASKQTPESDGWSDEEDGDGNNGVVARRSPMQVAFLAALENGDPSARDMAAALEAAAPRLVELCGPSRVKQVALLEAVAVLFEPGGQSELPGATLRLIGSSSLLRACKALYDEDVVQEEAVVEWVENMKTAARLSDAATHFTQRLKKMAPFVKWLQEAEEEESD